MSELILAIQSYRKRSIGTILRCASAFQASTVIIVGSADVSTHGAHGSQGYVNIVHFYYWSECLEYLHSLGVTVYYLSKSGNIKDEDIQLYPVQKQNFENNACFILEDRAKEEWKENFFVVANYVLYAEFPCQMYEDYVPYDAKVALCLQEYRKAHTSITNSINNEKYQVGSTTTKKAYGRIAYKGNSTIVGKSFFDADDTDDISALDIFSEN